MKQNSTLSQVWWLVLPIACTQNSDSTQAELQNRSPNNPQRQRSERRSGADRSPPQSSPTTAAVYPDEFRTIDGTFNNLENPEWGASDIPFLRLAPSAYADGTSTPSGGERPNPRLISNLCSAQAGEHPNAVGATDFVWQWGQFLDHDLDLSPEVTPEERFDIIIPTSDPAFDPRGTGTVHMPLHRSLYAQINGVREQLNAITAYIDASNVYGSDIERSRALRALDGSGELKVSDNELLPFNADGLDNAAPPGVPPTSLFIAGDFRANEQVGLTAMHTLFVREHNRLARGLRVEGPELSGDQIFERARAIVAAQMQIITYREFLPVLLGPEPLATYRGYRPERNPGISNTFATAAYRLGHSMLSSTLLRLGANGRPVQQGNLSLADAFFGVDEIVQTGIEPILRGLAAQQAQAIDPLVVDEVRNFLFGPPGAGGFDLVSLNIQRGRDHGLPSYQAVRQAFGLPPVRDFSQITSDPRMQDSLRQAYRDVEDIDPWVGMLAEPPVSSGMVGETLSAVMRDQFERLRDGDRFWYQTYLPQRMVQTLESQTLADIIRRNTSIGEELPDRVFRTGTGR